MPSRTTSRWSSTLPSNSAAEAERLARWRADTPGAAARFHLNNAGAALPPRPVVAAVLAHLEAEAELGGYEAAEAAADRVARAYASVGRLLGTPPDHKRHVVLTGGHYIIGQQRSQVVREVLDWLDRYLGPVDR